MFQHLISGRKNYSTVHSYDWHGLPHYLFPTCQPLHPDQVRPDQGRRFRGHSGARSWAWRLAGNIPVLPCLTSDFWSDLPASVAGFSHLPWALSLMHLSAGIAGRQRSRNANQRKPIPYLERDYRGAKAREHGVQICHSPRRIAATGVGTASRREKQTDSNQFGPDVEHRFAVGSAGSQRHVAAIYKQAPSNSSTRGPFQFVMYLCAREWSMPSLSCPRILSKHCALYCCQRFGLVQVLCLSWCPWGAVVSSHTCV